MNRTSKLPHGSDVANVVLSVLIGLTLIVSAVQPMKVSAATQIEQSPVIASVDTATLKTKELIDRDESAPVNVPDVDVADKPANDLQQSATWPVYFKVAIDEARGWIYGSDSAGAKIDVIQVSDLQLEKSISLPGTNPKGIALSPDGSELAVVNYGIGGMFDAAIGSIIFLNPDTNAIVASIIPDVWSSSSNRPWDVTYGRSGRLYSSGNPRATGLDFIHVIDTTSHLEVGRSSSPPFIRDDPNLVISSDFNKLIR